MQLYNLAPDHLKIQGSRISKDRTTLYLFFMQCDFSQSTCFIKLSTHVSLAGTQSFTFLLVTKLQGRKIIRVRVRMYWCDASSTPHHLNLHCGVTQAALSADLSMVVRDQGLHNCLVSNRQAALHRYLCQCHCKTEKIRLEK